MKSQHDVIIVAALSSPGGNNVHGDLLTPPVPTYEIIDENSTNTLKTQLDFSNSLIQTTNNVSDL